MRVPLKEQISSKRCQSLHERDKREASKANTAPTFSRDTSATRVLKSWRLFIWVPDCPSSASSTRIWSGGQPSSRRDFAEHSYGFRPGRGCREAVGRVEELLGQGRTWCVDADFKSYFDTIPHDRLMELVGQRVVDGSVLALLEQFLKAGVLEELKGWQPTE